MPERPDQFINPELQPPNYGSMNHGIPSQPLSVTQQLPYGQQPTGQPQWGQQPQQQWQQPMPPQQTWQSQPQMYPPPQYQQSAPLPTQMPSPQMAPQKPKSRKRLWIIIGIVAVVIIAIASGISQNINSNQANTPATQVATQPASTVQPTTQPPTTKPSTPQSKPTPTAVTFAQINSDGIFVVGKDVQSGTYRTRTGSPGCYYARLSGFGGSIGEIIANNTTDAPAIVTIAASDKGFQTTNCGTWTKV